MKKVTNHYASKSLADMTHIVNVIRRGEWQTPDWATERRFAVMEVTERLMDLHDSHGSLQPTIRGWVGEIQRIEGL